jgi:hypothetical protein
MSNGSSNSTAAPVVRSLVRRHRGFGWWSLLCFLAMGMGLEILHAFKVGWYLDVDTEPRRLMLRLAHTHGTLFALVHLAFAEGLQRSPTALGRWSVCASACLIAASICMPGGFVLGGVFVHAGDPGLGSLLAPVGGLFLLVGVFLVARAFTSQDVAD